MKLPIIKHKVINFKYDETPLTNWYKSVGVTPLKVERVLGSINDLIKFGIDQNSRTDAYNQGFSHGETKGIQDTKKVAEDKLLKEKLEAAKIGFLSKGNVILTKEGHVYSFDNLKNIITGPGNVNKEKFKTLTGEIELTPEIRETLIKGIFPYIESKIRKKMLEEIENEFQEHKKNITRRYEKKYNIIMSPEK
jgi:hypothetical protein